MVTRVRLPVVGGLVKVLASPTGTTPADIANLQAAVTALNSAVQALQQAPTHPGETSAPPSAKVGLTAVNGTSVSFMTSDSAPPIDQTISPTWTGYHTFNHGIEFPGQLHTAIPFIQPAEPPDADPAAFGVIVNAGAPSALVGLTAIAGVSPNFMRADAAPALNQAISPTMTGNWLFNATSGQPVGITAPSGQTALVVTSGNSSTTSNGDVIVQRAGSTANAQNEGANYEMVDTVANSAGNIQWSGNQLEVWQGIGASVPVHWQMAFWDANGGLHALAPRSGGGAAITATALAGQPGITSTGSGAPAFYSNTDGIVALQMNSSGSDWGMVQNDSGNNWSLAHGTSITALGTPVLKWNNLGNVSIPTPVSGTALAIVGGPSTSTCVAITAGASGGAGYSANDGTATYLFGAGILVGGVWSVYDVGHAAERLKITNAGQVSAFEPSYGISALTNIATNDSTTFTGTLTGMTGATTGTVHAVRCGNMAILYTTAAITGTSNSTSMTMTGLPTEFQPVNTQETLTIGIEDNTVPGIMGATFMNAGSGTITFQKINQATLSTTAFTNGGTKGLTSGWFVIYSLV